MPPGSSTWKASPSAASPAVLVTVIEGATSSRTTVAASESKAVVPAVSSSSAVALTVSVNVSPALPLDGARERAGVVGTRGDDGARADVARALAVEVAVDVVGEAGDRDRVARDRAVVDGHVERDRAARLVDVEVRAVGGVAGGLGDGDRGRDVVEGDRRRVVVCGVGPAGFVIGRDDGHCVGLGVKRVAAYGSAECAADRFAGSEDRETNRECRRVPASDTRDPPASQARRARSHP